MKSVDKILLGKIRRMTIGGNDPLKEGFSVTVGFPHKFKEKGVEITYEVVDILWDEPAHDLYGINRYIVFVKDVNDPDVGVFPLSSYEGYQGIALQYFKP